MNLNRRNFIQLTTLGLASVMSGLSSSSFASPKQSLPATKPLAITMPSPDGKYAFLVDGKRQVVSISGEAGSLNIPHHSCIIEYTGEDGTTKISVYIDQETSQSFLFPGLPSKEINDEPEWGTVLLGNPIRGGKVVTQISGPANTNPVVEIIDISGRTLMKEKVQKNSFTEQYTFDVQRYSKGMLLVKVTCDDYSQTLKVLHQN